MKKFLRPLVVLLIAAGIIAYAAWRSARTAVAEVKIVGFQDADVPLPMPEKGQPDPRFHRFSPWQMNEIPEISRMDPPMGSENGALVYNAQPFWEMNRNRGGHHTGDDLNGIGGMNSDLGDPVFASADGLVVYSGNPSPGWGNIVVLAHRLESGAIVQTMYAHLLAIKTSHGTLVARGDPIGTVGTADGHYPAHLHFEARDSDGIDIGGGYGSTTLNRIRPSDLITTLHDPGPGGISPAPLRFLDFRSDAPWTALEITNPAGFPGLGK